MQITSDDVKTIFSMLAFFTSVVSIILTRVNWRQSNRPVVSVFVVEESIGNGVGTFNFSVANSGTRPATNIRFYIDDKELEKLIDPTADSKAKLDVAQCFSSESNVPLLRNGEVLTGGFGHSSNNGLNKPQLNYGAEANVRVEYSDLEGKKYSSFQPIKIYTRNGFTGSSWESAA